ncbi:MAG TPA: hypothetical protein VHX86_18360 [Tepidisphaeraceae bacterium]|jgi:hypothetical protein|nr:hypothetical protein [Tepidisphaeraceae bacterium]
MSELKELVGLGDSSAFPGHTLSPPRLIEFAEAEEEAAAQYLRGIAKSAAGLPAAVRDAIHQRAVDNLRVHPFSYGSHAFDQWALSMSAAPFLTWLLLRIKHPKLTLPEASQLLCDGEYAAKVGTVWSMWGYKPAKKAAAPAASGPIAPGTNAPSTGGASSRTSPAPDRRGSD